MSLIEMAPPLDFGRSQSNKIRTPDEKYMLGTVVGARKIDPARLGLEGELEPAMVGSVVIRDPYEAMLDPSDIQEVAAAETIADRFARERRKAGCWERVPKSAYTDEDGKHIESKEEWGDPVSRELFFGRYLGSEAIDNWRTHIPSANALMHLSDPMTIESITDKSGKNFAEMDPVARLWLTACTDARAIRARGTVLAELVRGYVRDSDMSEKSVLKWMSVACGTALPAMKAAIAAGIKPELILADHDPGAMRATKRLSEEIGFEGLISQHRSNIFDAETMAQLSEDLGSNGGRPRIIDLMGIFEYTGEHLGVDPACFLRSNYEMLGAGGRLILGQMRDDRPNPDFTMGVVGWPYVEMRSPRELMKIFSNAGISSEEVSLYLPEDGVYMVASIDKPEDAANSFAIAA